MRKKAYFLFFTLFVILGCINKNKDNLTKTDRNTQFLESKSDSGYLSLTDSTMKTQKYGKGYYAEIVVVEDSKFIDDIENLIKDNKCINRRADLILDYTDENSYIFLWQSNIKNNVHIYERENKNIYITFLNNNPLFIIFNEVDKLDLLIRKTGFKIDLDEYLNNYAFVAHHLSYWYLSKKKEGGVEVIREMLVNCNK